MPPDKPEPTYPPLSQEEYGQIREYLWGLQDFLCQKELEARSANLWNVQTGLQKEINDLSDLINKVDNQIED